MQHIAHKQKLELQQEILREQNINLGDIAAKRITESFDHKHFRSLASVARPC
jgi:hypothetical protein